MIKAMYTTVNFFLRNLKLKTMVFLAFKKQVYDTQEYIAEI